LNFQYKS